jgi:hypothetical protein
MLTRKTPKITRSERIELQNTKYRLFALAYLSMSKLYGSEVLKAKLAAGKVVGIKSVPTVEAWLCRPMVVQTMQEELAKVELRYGKRADDVLSEIAITAFSDPQNYFNQDVAGTLTIKQLKDMGESRRAIKTIRQKTVVTESGGSENPVKTTTNYLEVELWSKDKALETLARYHRLIDRVREDDNRISNEGAGCVNVFLPDNGRGNPSLMVGVKFDK